MRDGGRDGDDGHVGVGQDVVADRAGDGPPETGVLAGTDDDELCPARHRDQLLAGVALLDLERRAHLGGVPTKGVEHPLGGARPGVRGFSFQANFARRRVIAGRFAPDRPAADYLPGKIIRFGKANEAYPYLGTGWGGPDEISRWTTGLQVARVIHF